MFEPFLETGSIIDVDNKQYLVLGIYNKDLIKKERKIYVDKVLKNVENMRPIKPSYYFEAKQNLYYYYLYYESKTVKEFVIRILEHDDRLLVCDYSSYPVIKESDFLFNLIGTKKKVGKIKEKDVKLNLLKGTFFNKFLAKISTTTEVYDMSYSDVKDSKITKEQKDYLKNSMMEQLNFIAMQYEIAKNTFSYCIAEIFVNKKHYLGYICFTKDHVNVFSICKRNVGLKKKIELIFDVNYPMFELDFKDVKKVEKVC